MRDATEIIISSFEWVLITGVHPKCTVDLTL